MTVNLGSIFYRLGVNTTGLNKANKDVKNFETKSKKSFANATRSAITLSRSIKGIIAAETARRILKTGDSFQMLKNRINAMIGDVEGSKAVFSELQKISEATGNSIQATAGGFQKMLFAKDTVGATTGEMVQLTKAMTQLGVISNSDVGQMNSAMLQFSQGLISGTFQAQEFQSVLEGIPAIAQYMADGMGITTGELIKLKKEGKLTSKDVFDALISQTDQINKRAQDLPMNMSRGFSRLTLGVGQLIDKINTATRTTETLGNIMFKSVEHISNINIYLEVFFETLKRITSQIKIINKAMSVVGDTVDFVVKKSNKMFESANKYLGIFFEKVKETRKQSDLLDKTMGSIGDTSQYIAGKSSKIFESVKNAQEKTKEFVKKFQNDITQKIIQEEQKRLEKIQSIDYEEIKNKQKKAYAMLKIDEWYNKSRKAFEKKYIDEKGKIDNTGLQQAGENFAQQIQLASQHSKEFFELNKALAIANIAIKTPEAIANAYAYGTAVGSPIVGGIFAGIAGSAMAVQASAIANQSYTPRAVGGSIYPNGSYLVGENGAEILQMGNSAGRIIPNSDISGGGSSAKVNVNVYNLEGQTAKVEQQSDGMGGVNLKVIIESVENSIAQGINSGTGNLNKALSNIYGMNRAYGSY
jgi:tape measure domain-containing protein